MNTNKNKLEEKALRQASHAGSWYAQEDNILEAQLEGWLNKAKLTDSSARAIISPHAGYSYSGQSAAYGFKNLDHSKIKRIFILGPSHHVYFTKCALSGMDEYETPLGNIPLDKEVINELYATGSFDWMKKSVDEEEHSIEMQLPYIFKQMNGAAFTLVPILVGKLSKSSEEQYGSILAKYLDEPTNFFVISSDFCHWGKRFDYHYYEPSEGPIYKSIECLDKRGMEAIESQDPEIFYSYQKNYKNTICGRHPIGLFMQTAANSKNKHKFEFVYYTQSNQCTSNSDSSVSYAVCVITKC